MAEECPLITNKDFPLPSEEFGEVVIFAIGEEEKKYHVHKGLLLHYSGYFRAQFNGRWKVEKEIPLPSEETTTFSAFLAFIYHGQLQDRPLKKRKREHGDQSNAQLSTPPALSIEQLCKIYVFGDIHIIPLLKSCVTHAICERLSLHTPESTPAIKYAFENTVEGSGLRNLFVDYYAEYRLPRTNSKSWSAYIRAERDNIHPDFTLEVTCRLFEQRLLIDPRFKAKPSHDFVKRDLCQYHDHQEIEDDTAALSIELVYSVIDGESSTAESSRQSSAPQIIAHVVRKDNETTHHDSDSTSDSDSDSDQ